MGRVRGSRRALSIAALTAVVALSSCSTSEPMPSPTPSYSSTYLTPPPIALAPLTGEVIDPGSLTTPSLAAKVDNHPNARPQQGLENTDLVFEELVEGGLTRYVAVWHSDVPAEIGPIRSIRPMDPDIVSPLGGIIAYSGGQYRFVVMMQQTEVYNAIHGQADADPFMFRQRGRPGPHDVIVRAPELIAANASIPAPAQQFAFAPDPASSTAGVSGTPTETIALRFGAASQPSWYWNAGRALWERSQGGSPDLDLSGVPYSAVNVVVLRVPITVDQSIPKTELIGSGEACVSTAGKTICGTWSKDARTAPIRLVDTTGTVIQLGPGNSWIELVPLAGDASYAAPPEPEPTESAAP